ncbi:MAG: hypothetical protein WCJ40_18135, partial [Planctomycetota bacterium]
MRLAGCCRRSHSHKKGSITFHFRSLEKFIRITRVILDSVCVFGYFHGVDRKTALCQNAMYSSGAKLQHFYERLNS